MENIRLLWESTGLYNFTLPQAIMMVVGFVLLFLAIKKGFEPLLLLPIGFGAMLTECVVGVMALIAAVLTFMYGLILCSVAIRVSARWSRQPGLGLWLNRIAGLVMIGFGLRMILMR